MTPDDLEARVSTLEQTVAELNRRHALLTEDAQAARVLAAGADLDVSQVRVELRANRTLLNALRETQREHGERLDGIDGRLEKIEVRLGGIDGRLGGIDGRLDNVDGRLGGIDGRLERVEVNMAAGFATMQAGMNQIVALLTERPA